ncbi:MAG: hypothetical protein OXU25_06450 [Thaumarchaeota archaeon]|nr:hypothetical protein [Nitrososphaerota archaeon]
MTKTKRTPNDDRSDSMNERTVAGKAAKEHHEQQVRENRKKAA